MICGQFCLATLAALVVALMQPAKVKSGWVIDCESDDNRKLATAPWKTFDVKSDRGLFGQCVNSEPKGCGISRAANAKQPDFTVCPGQFFEFEKGKELLLCETDPLRGGSSSVDVSYFVDKPEHLAMLKGRIVGKRKEAQRAGSKEYQAWSSEQAELSAQTGRIQQAAEIKREMKIRKSASERSEQYAEYTELQKELKKVEKAIAVGKKFKAKLTEPQLPPLEPLPDTWEAILKALPEVYAESKKGDDCKPK